MDNAEGAVEAGRLRVTVVFCPAPGVVDSTPLDLPVGATLADAVQASGLLQRHALGQGETLLTGIWNKPRALDAPLRDADRVEVYRPLQVDPKEARRLRYRGQKARAPAGKSR